VCGSKHQAAIREALIRDGAVRLYVRAVGAGRPIVVVHGGPDFDHEYLLPELDRLGEKFRVVYYDQRGRGRSFAGEQPGDVTIETEIADLDRVRAWTRSDTITILGHSWGGLLAIEYAIANPRRVSHLILMNTAPVSHAGALAFRRALLAGRSSAQRKRMAALASDSAFQRGDLEADAEYYRLHFGATFGSRDDLERLVGRLRKGFTSDGIVAARAIEDSLYGQTWRREDYDLTQRLRRLQVRALVLGGQHDFIPADIGRDIASAIPGARLVVLSGCGHFAFLEQPSRVCATIAEFLVAA